MAPRRLSLTLPYARIKIASSDMDSRQIVVAESTFSSAEWRSFAAFRRGETVQIDLGVDFESGLEAACSLVADGLMKTGSARGYPFILKHDGSHTYSEQVCISHSGQFLSATLRLG